MPAVRMMVEDRAARGSQALLEATTAMVSKAAQTPGLTQVFTLFENSTPQIYLEIDRTKAQLLGINVADVFAALQVYVGSAYVNDFNLLGRVFRVTAQADAAYRRDPGDILKIRVRNSRGKRCRSVLSRPFATLPARIACRATISILRPSSMPRRAGFLAGPGHRGIGEDRGRDLCPTDRIRVDRSPSSRSGRAALHGHRLHRLR